MKGIVFNLLNEMVEEEFGLAAWEQILDDAQSKGIFVATETYHDNELLSLVASAEKVSGISANELVRSFGAYMIPKFAQQYPGFFERHNDVKEFLLTVDQIIHVEVRKLYPDAGLPEFTYQDFNDRDLTMLYRSPRKLCTLAEGLIDGAAKHFDQTYTMQHDVCMHRGSDHCELNMRFAQN